MKRREWTVLAVLGALVVVMIVVGIKVFSGNGGHDNARSDSSPTATGSTAAPPPPPSSGEASGPSDTGDSVLPGSDLQNAHKVMTGYVAALRSYSSDDRQQPWQQDALAKTDNSPAMRQLTKLPTGKAWAECVHTRCTVKSTATVLRDPSITDVPGEGGGRQIVSYVDVHTVTTQKGTEPQKQTSQFIVTAVKSGGDWRVIGCSFAGIGDTGANGDGP
ncbi:MAG TPA: hypothetical protein VHC49_16070 [Mycobacteriales bacterium]|nr:hypothetical protein [Mycobacteriales bacterium]